MITSVAGLSSLSDLYESSQGTVSHMSFLHQGIDDLEGMKQQSAARTRDVRIWRDAVKVSLGADLLRYNTLQLDGLYTFLFCHDTSFLDFPFILYYFLLLWISTSSSCFNGIRHASNRSSSYGWGFAWNGALCDTFLLLLIR
ncbi:hypothetical protein BDV11DRAFT_91013 [Aspergillus similis]